MMPYGLGQSAPGPKVPLSSQINGDDFVVEDGRHSDVQIPTNRRFQIKPLSSRPTRRRSPPLAEQAQFSV
ncbi:MAG TPA: hypothetical protein VN829_16470 [Dongiaceae bacterium]|nr:hypothetical protein [Dongiaceae bacterium]